MKRKISKDIGKDFITADINVELFPSYKIVDNKPTLIKKDDPINVTYKIILDPNGCPVYPQNLYFHYLKTKGLKNIDTHAQALLAYTRWLSAVGMEYSDLTKNPQEGAPWKFSEFLISNLKDKQEDGTIKNPDGFAISTARMMLSVVIRFYKWLHYSGFLTWNKDRKPFDITNETIRLKNTNQHNMLSHLDHEKILEVESTSLMKMFPKVQSRVAAKKLKPMSIDDKILFESHLDKNMDKGGQNYVKALICKTTLATGLRLHEIVTLPDYICNMPDGDVTLTIGAQNNVKTKFGKTRRIIVPYDVALELYEYRLSDQRISALNKSNIEIDENFEQKGENSHNRLFVNISGKVFSNNTIQTFLGKIKRDIQVKKPNWNYSYHDLRSTFATYWLYEQAQSRNNVFDFYLGELAELLGHNDTKTTQKYIDFVNSELIKKEYSKNQNDLANDSINDEDI